jgi:hypothetical protein
MLLNFLVAFKKNTFVAKTYFLGNLTNHSERTERMVFGNATVSLNV